MSIESREDLRGLRRAGRAVAETLRETRRRVRPGVTTADLDAVARAVFEAHGARSAPALVYGFPGTILVSINDQVVHGVPGDRVIGAGDLVKIDVTAELDGYMADAAVTVTVPPVSEVAARLRRCVESAFRRAIRRCRAGLPIRAIGRVVEGEVRRHGFAVVPELCGHGIGRVIHEEPSIPNFDDPEATRSLTEGLVITIEPIVTSGAGEVERDADGWTERTVDGSLAAHFEHTVVVTRGAPLLLTA